MSQIFLTKHQVLMFLDTDNHDIATTIFIHGPNEFFNIVRLGLCIIHCTYTVEHGYNDFQGEIRFDGNYRDTL